MAMETVRLAPTPHPHPSPGCAQVALDVGNKVCILAGDFLLSKSAVSQHAQSALARSSPCGHPPHRSREAAPPLAQSLWARGERHSPQRSTPHLPPPHHLPTISPRSPHDLHQVELALLDDDDVTELIARGLEAICEGEAGLSLTPA